MAVSSKAIHPPSDDGAFKSILERRIPQIIGIYIGGIWTFFGIVQWMVNRYVLSPHLEELVLLAALLFLPSIGMLAYGHGAPGRNPWRAYEKIGLLCNAILAVGFLVFMFGGKDLGSAQKKVQIVDAEGNEVERLVPKEAFRKRLALFYFDNASGDPDLDWMREAIPTIWDADLDQDLFLTLQTSELFLDKFQKAGFKDGLNIPLALKRNLTSDYNLAYFLSGSIDKKSDEFIITTQLNETKGGKQLATHQYAGADVFPLIDQMTVDLKNDLDLPKKHIEETVDLPVSETFTGSPAALKFYRNGLQEATILHDFPAAIASFEQATANDPTFAMAYVQKYVLLLQQGQMQPALQALSAAQQHNYRLTEQFKFLLKVGELNLGGNQEEALNAANQWRTLYPDDVQAHQIVGLLYVIRNQFDEALAAYQKLLTIDPYQDQASLEVGRLLKETGKVEEAIKHYLAFAERYPDRNDGYSQLAQIYYEQGDLDKELETRKIALSIAPDDPAAFRKIGDVMKHKGNLDEALKQYKTALTKSNTPKEQAESHQSIGDYFWLRGQHSKAITQYDKTLELVQANFPAVFSIVQQGRLVSQYYEAGYVQQMKEFIEQALANPTTRQFPDLMVLTRKGASHIYSKEGEFEEALALLEEADAVVEASSFFLLKPQLLYAKGLVLKEDKQYDEAKQVFEAFLKTETTSTAGWNRLGEVQLALSDFKTAEGSFKKGMRYFPGSPISHLGIAKAKAGLGETEEAISHLDKALAVWNEAEETSAQALEARELREKPEFNKMTH